MKKVIALVLALLTLTLVFSACGTTPDDKETTKATETADKTQDTAAETEDEDKKSEGVMTYAQYDAAALDTQVVVETYIQAKQGWWENNGVGNATFYTQDDDGAYFLYNMPCTEAEYAQLTEGTKIKVTGYKSEWSGEVEITDATFEIIAGKTKIYDAKDVTALLGTDDLIKSQNQRVAFKGMTIVASKNVAGEDVAFLYKWDGSGQAGDDLYFKVSDGKETYTFTVESYLCGKDTDVYKAIEGLTIGAVVDLEGFLYWYNGVNPHITSCAAAK